MAHETEGLGGYLEGQERKVIASVSPDLVHILSERLWPRRELPSHVKTASLKPLEEDVEVSFALYNTTR